MDSGFLILVGALFLVATLGVYFGAQRLEDFFSAERFHSESEAEGAPRSVFHIFYILITWACFTFLLPLSLGYFAQLERYADNLMGILSMVAQILFGPLIVLLLLLYGIRRNFLNWVKDVAWPNEKGKSER